MLNVDVLVCTKNLTLLFAYLIFRLIFHSDLFVGRIRCLEDILQVESHLSYL